jgi:hypothetical protein
MYQYSGENMSISTQSIVEDLIEFPKRIISKSLNNLSDKSTHYSRTYILKFVAGAV